MQNIDQHEGLTVVTSAATTFPSRQAHAHTAPTRMSRSRDTSPASLQRRLEEGWDLIEAAHARGEDIRTLEDHWIRLLHQYELQCQQEAA